MFPRHSLVWLSEAGWRSAIDAAPPAAGAALAHWARQDWPAVVRRQEPGVPDDDACIGIALPSSPQHKIAGRIGSRVPLSAVRKASPAAGLASVIAAAHPDWRAPLAMLDREAAQAQLVLRVYGSLALQAITGQTYLSASSDIDLLLQPVSMAGLRDGLRLLDRYATLLPLDGELVFPSGQAVAWKEWKAVQDAPGARVLVKERHGARLLHRDTLLQGLREPACLE